MMEVLEMDSELQSCKEIWEETIRRYSTYTDNTTTIDGITVKLNLRGKLFHVSRCILLRMEGTYFYAMLSSGTWLPDNSGVYHIDRPSEGFERILDYLDTGALCWAGLTTNERTCLEENLNYFLIKFGDKSLNFSRCLLLSRIGESVRSIAQLLDHRVVVAAGHILKVINLENGVCEKDLIGDTSAVLCVVSLEDGRICSGAADGTIRVWDAVTGVCDIVLSGFIDAASTAACFSLLSFSETAKRLPNSHTKSVRSVIQLYDGRICSGSDDGSVKLWNLSTGECEMTMKGPSQATWVEQLMQLKDGRIYSRNFLSNDRIWNIHAGDSEEVRWLRGFSIARLNDGRLCIGRYEVIYIYNVMANRIDKMLQGHGRGPVNILLPLKNGRLCSASNDCTIRCWDVSTGECLWAMRSPHYFLAAIELSDGRLCTASGSADCDLKLWG